MIATELPAAIRPYSMAVAPVSSYKGLRIVVVIDMPLTDRHNFYDGSPAAGPRRSLKFYEWQDIWPELTPGLASEDRDGGLVNFRFWQPANPHRHLAPSGDAFSSGATPSRATFRSTGKLCNLWGLP